MFFFVHGLHDFWKDIVVSVVFGFPHIVDLFRCGNVGCKETAPVRVWNLPNPDLRQVPSQVHVCGRNLRISFHMVVWGERGYGSGQVLLEDDR